MIADSNSSIAWHRVQLRKNREAVKALEIARFRVGAMAGPAGDAQQKALATLKRRSPSPSDASPPTNGAPSGRSQPTFEASCK